MARFTIRRHRTSSTTRPAGTLLLFVLLSAGTARGQEPVALVGGTLIDGRGGAPVTDAVIVIRDGRIECAGPRSACPIPARVRTVDARGRWLLPGIVDAHVHYSQTGWADGRPDALDMRERFPYIETIAKLKDPRPFYRANLCSGVTATFDVGGFPWTWTLRSAAERDPGAPHVSAAGPLLSTRDHWLNVPGERQFLHIGSDSAVQAGARYLIANRTDAMKVWFLAGASSPDTADWRRRIDAAGELARGAGIPLIVHATGLWQAKAALRAGAKLLVHGVSDMPVDEEFLELARRNGTVYTPTLVVTNGYLQLRARAFDRAAYGESLACVDPQTRAKAFLTDSLPGGVSAEQAAQAKQAAARRSALEADNVRRVHAAGIPVAMGTDAGNPLTLHGPSVYLEMEALHAAGLKPLEVIVAATRNGALAMGRLADFGTIERGKIADIIVLRADPLADIRNVRSVELIVRGGAVQRRSELTF
jgi:imidazolonepropionase-like amidohydrolase